MPDKFTIEFEREGGLWYAKSRELNCFMALRDLKAICNDIPNIVALVDKRHDDELSKCG